MELLEATPPSSPRNEASFPENFGYWKERSPDEVDENCIVEVTGGEFEQLKDLFMKSLERGREVRTEVVGYGQRIFEVVPKILSISRMENPTMLECFKAAERKMICENKRRTPEEQFKGSPQTVAFHGTTRRNMEKIHQYGFKVHCPFPREYFHIGDFFCLQGQFNDRFKYGIGTYTDKNGQIAMQHATDTILVCRVLTGKQGHMASGARGPSLGLDSGTDFSEQWINVSFHDCEVSQTPFLASDRD